MTPTIRAAASLPIAMENQAAYASASTTPAGEMHAASGAPTQEKPWTVLVVAHDPQLKQQLVQAIAAMIEVGSVRGAHTLETGLVAIDGGMVDLLLADLDLPEDGGLTLIRHARRRLPGCKVLALASPATAETHLPTAIQTGALGWLQTQNPATQTAADVATQIRQLLATN